MAGPEEQLDLLPITSPAAERALLDVRGGGIRVRATIAALVSCLGDRLEREEALSVQPDGIGALLAKREKSLAARSAEPTALTMLRHSSAAETERATTFTTLAPTRCER